MNFLSILEGKRVKPEEIAMEIVELENKLPIFEDAISIAEKKAVKIRQSKLGGGKFDVKEMDRAMANLSDEKLNLDALKLSINELREKLVIAIESQVKLAASQIDRDQDKLNQLKKENREEVVKFSAKLQALAIRYKVDIPTYAATQVEPNIGENVHIYPGSTDYTVFVDEVKKHLDKLGNKSGLGIQALENLLLGKIQRLEQQDLDVTIEFLLNEARSEIFGDENV